MTRQDIVSNFIDSLERERNIMKLTQAQMAEKLEMSVSGYKKLISGETAKIDLYTAYQMHQFTGKWTFELCGCVPSDLMQAASKLRSLTPSQLRFVSSVMDFELLIQNQIPPKPEYDYVNLLTPTCALEDGMIWDSMNIEKINIASYRERFGSRLQCAMKITGNYLRPVYLAGDILLLSQTAPRDGEIGIFINKKEGRIYIRRFHQTNPYTLEPLNGYGLTFKVDIDDSNWINFGHVLCKMRE